MLELIREYKNNAGDLLRLDTILMERRANTLASKAETHTFKRHVKTENINSTGISNRVVDEVIVSGNYDSIDGSAYAWATWESPVVTVDMSDLPFVGDTV